MRRLVLVPMLFVASTFVSGCATQIIGAEMTSTTIAAERPAPVGNAGELLGQMRSSFETLSKALADGDRNRARAEFDYVERIWTALEPEITPLGDQFVKDARRVVDLAGSAVTRNRPADADKALRFIDLVIAALPA